MAFLNFINWYIFNKLLYNTLDRWMLIIKETDNKGNTMKYKTETLVSVRKSYRNGIQGWHFLIKRMASPSVNCRPFSHANYYLLLKPGIFHIWRVNHDIILPNNIMVHFVLSTFQVLPG